MLLIPNKLKKEIEAESKERAVHFVKNSIEEIAEKYHKKMPDLWEFWIFIAAKRDKRSGSLNAIIRAVDRANLHLVNQPIQGAQLWYINWKTGEKRLEWILPLQSKKSKVSVDSYTNSSPIVLSSLLQAEKVLGKNLATGK